MPDDIFHTKEKIHRDLCHEKHDKIDMYRAKYHSRKVFSSNTKFMLEILCVCIFFGFSLINRHEINGAHMHNKHIHVLHFEYRIQYNHTMKQGQI